MKEIYINADDYNSDSIRTIQGNNNAEEYKIYLQYDNEKIDLTGKTVNLAFLKVGSTEGDIIENLNVTNPKEGEITLKITNKITKQNGTYSCQLAISGKDNFLEHTATFSLTVENNIFSDITKAIADSKDFTYLERILEEAKTVSGDLKTNIPIATNLNSSLESNISNSRNINTTLADTTEKSKVAAMDAIEKKSDLESSIVEAKKFIDGLDESQNIPQIRLDVTELQNGLKSNQSLEYSGSSITANDTLEGRTEGMRIKGRTLRNLFCANESFSLNTKIGWINNIIDLQVANEKYTLVNNTNLAIEYQIMYKDTNIYKKTIGVERNSIVVYTLKENEIIAKCEGLFKTGWKTGDLDKLRNTCYILKGDWTNKNIPNYFEGVKSCGEQEGFKISTLSTGKNLFNTQKIQQGTATNFKNSNGIISGTIANQYNGTTSVKININEKTKVLIRANLKGCRLMINNCWLESGEFRNMIDTNNWNDNISDFQVGQRILYIDSNSSIKIENPHNTSVNFIAKDICCYKIDGTENQPYQAYQSDKKDILIKEPLRENDTMYEDDGKIKIYRISSQYTFNGNENIGINGINANTIEFVIIPYNVNIKGNSKIISNNFNNITGGDLKGIRVSSSGKIIIHLYKSELKSPDVESFKEWLKANLTTIIYQLATPTIEIVENCIDIDLDTYQEKTYFNILNSLPGTLDFKVPSNIASIVQNTAKEVNNIWDVINNLLVPSIVKANGNIAMIKLNNNLK